MTELVRLKKTAQDGIVSIERCVCYNQRSIWGHGKPIVFMDTIYIIKSDMLRVRLRVCHQLQIEASKTFPCYDEWRGEINKAKH